MNSRHQRNWQVAPTEEAGLEAVFLPSIGEYPIYDETAYQFMLDDEARMKAFRQALVDIVRPDSTVVELGAGSFAPWARQAADLGAARVVAVEVIPEVRMRLARALSEDPRYRRIMVLSEEQYQRAQMATDILVSEVIGAIGSSEGALRVVSAAIERLDNAQLHVLPQGWTTNVTAFSWRRILRGAKPRFAPASSAYLSMLQDLLGEIDPRLCVVGPSCRLGLVSDTQALETATFGGRTTQLDLKPATLTIRNSSNIDSLLLTVDVAIGQHVVSSMKHASSWLPVVVPFGQDPLSVAPGDQLHVSMQHQYETHPVCPDYIISWKLFREGVEVAAGSEALPWSPSQGIGQDPLHAALSTRGSSTHE